MTCIMVLPYDRTIKTLEKLVAESTAAGGTYLVMTPKQIHCGVNYAWPNAKITVMGDIVT